MKTILIAWLVASPIASITIGWLLRRRFGNGGRVSPEMDDHRPYVGAASVVDLATARDGHPPVRRYSTVMGGEDLGAAMSVTQLPGQSRRDRQWRTLGRR